MKDVIIIGAGVSGCAIARELSRYQLDICVLERESDICEGTSKANSGIVHGGFDAKPGTLKAKLNVLGNSMMDEMSKKLDFEFKRNGSMVVCQNEMGIPALEKLLEQGKENGVKGMKILKREQALELEPNLADGVYAVLYIPSGGIVCPFGMNIAYAENAAQNGVEFKLGTEVQLIERVGQDYRIQTNQGVFDTKYVINAAGVYADVFHNMVSELKIHIMPRRGDYCLLDKTAGDLVRHTIFQLPTEKGKGVLVTPTIHGNLLLGPTAIDIEDKEATATTAKGLQEVLEKCTKSVKNIPFKQVITSFAGLRAHEEHGEFIIGEVEDAKGFIDVAGIESPGLTSAPAIGIYVRDILAEKMELKEKEIFVEERKGIVRFLDLPKEEQNRLLQKNQAYGQIVCRCEQITEGEILDAIHRPLGATTLDGVKRRTRAGMGRCQAGFCTPKVMEILARELHLELKDIRKNGRRDAR
ncbi:MULTISPECIES: NAD(P)/FAD-dependent oxidoreductase [Lachnospiraceae]|uniref:NAD(P)/FAD-dependent oxidoreductase n=1 Tax=Lachnospiraceae TaxID=186803 RepID=UPI001F280359|nr:NAD(P)/FAD-dependent oxidoreductase [Faecalicatena contorta]MCF2669461.1 NAD(P)/FAD-dependent oxidoreductase [Faecalicatena contorta]MDY4206258.1 NAD(P)/FAD-dependent oxidoreductase [Lachnospiraceae bacterium]